MNNIDFLKQIHAGANDCFREDDEVVSHIAILRSWIDSEDPDKLAYIYDPDDNRFYDRLYSYERFLEECDRLINLETEESYFSINSFWRKNKETEDIRHLNAFALDFDYYKIKKFKDLKPIEMYEQHIKDILPFTPTTVIDSGRGLYVIYNFKHCSIMRMKLYRCIYKQFYKLLKPYGMDAKAMNVTQVIRIPGTYNVKADKVVKILETNITTYDITDFCTLLPYTLEQTKKHKKTRYSEEQTTSTINAQDLKKRRKKECKELLDDLLQLIVLRNKAGYYEGYREQLLYIAVEKMLWSGMSRDRAIVKAESINEQFHYPLPLSAVRTQCVPNKIYWHCNSITKILDKLEITDNEQNSLTFLQTRERKDLKKKRLRNKHPLLNRTCKEVELLRRRTLLINLKKQGKSNTQIANSLETNKSTITRDLHYIQKNKNEFRKTLGETIEALIASMSDVNLLRCVTYDTQLKLHKWLETGISMLADP